MNFFSNENKGERRMVKLLPWNKYIKCQVTPTQGLNPFACQIFLGIYVKTACFTPLEWRSEWVEKEYQGKHLVVDGLGDWKMLVCALIWDASELQFLFWSYYACWWLFSFCTRGFASLHQKVPLGYLPIWKMFVFGDGLDFRSPRGLSSSPTNLRFPTSPASTRKSGLRKRAVPLGGERSPKRCGSIN